MINQTMKHSQGPRLWMLSPSCLIDKILDHLEKLCGFVVSAKTDDLLHITAEPEARLEQFGA